MTINDQKPPVQKISIGGNFPPSMLAESALTLSQFNVLTAILLLEEEATASEISRQIDADRSTLSRELGLIESRGLVETSQISGRRRVLKLSEQGEAVYRAAWEQWQCAIQEVDSMYGAERMAETHRLLTNLLAVHHGSDKSDKSDKETSARSDL